MRISAVTRAVSLSLLCTEFRERTLFAGLTLFLPLLAAFLFLKLDHVR